MQGTGRIRGWLILLIPLLIIGAVIYTFLCLGWSSILLMLDNNSYEITEEILAAKQFGLLSRINIAFNACWAVLSLVMLILLLVRYKKFPERLKLYLFSGVAVQFVTILSIQNTLFLLGYSYNIRLTLFIPFIIYLIWKQCCYKSKRLREAFPESPYLKKLDRKEKSVLDITIPDNPEPLPQPCQITLYRDRSSSGGLVNFNVVFNGSYIGDVANGGSLTFMTGSRQNIIMTRTGTNSTKPFYFEITGICPVELHVRGFKFLPEKCWGIRQILYH